MNNYNIDFLKVKMLLFFKYNNFLKRKTAINVFFGSYRKGKYRTLKIETEPSYAETHPKTKRSLLVQDDSC
jgi:hypothetical protein